MKTSRERLAIRMRKDRVWAPITMNVPEDVIDDLKEIAPALGFGNYLALARMYIGEGLRKDLARLDDSSVIRLTESLRKQGLSDDIISSVIVEADLKRA